MILDFKLWSFVENISLIHLAFFLSSLTFPFFSSRLFGLKDIIRAGNCSSPYELQLNLSYDWPVYVSPGILFLLYITLAAVLKTESHETAHQVFLFISLTPWFLGKKMFICWYCVCVSGAKKGGNGGSKGQHVGVKYVEQTHKKLWRWCRGESLKYRQLKTQWSN